LTSKIIFYCVGSFYVVITIRFFVICYLNFPEQQLVQLTHYKSHFFNGFYIMTLPEQTLTFLDIAPAVTKMRKCHVKKKIIFRKSLLAPRGSLALPDSISCWLISIMKIFPSIVVNKS